MTDVLAELFSSRVRAAVLGHLLPRSHLGFSLTDLSRRLDLPISSLQHECYRLTRLGVLRDQRAGASRLYQPDPSWPLLRSLAGLIGGALPLQATLSGAVEGMPGLVEAIFAGEVPPSDPSDLGYLILVGDLSIEDVDAAYARVLSLLAARIDPRRVELAFFRPDDWRARTANPSDFWAMVLSGPIVRATPWAAPSSQTYSPHLG